MISTTLIATQMGKAVATLTAVATQTGKAAAGLTVVAAMIQSYFPCELRVLLMDFYDKFVDFIYPYIQITFYEYQGEYFSRSKAYAAIERYLNANATSQAKRLLANVFDDTDAVVLSVAKNEEVTDVFDGIKLWWTSSEDNPRKQSVSFWPREEERRYFRVTFYRKHRQQVTGEYVKHVLERGKAITVEERRRKLCTNRAGGDGYGFRGGFWSQVVFEHPATFCTLAMDPIRKEKIIKDLHYFEKSEEYYKKVGKALKRGYLFHGPPGTGKATMIAAMANLLQYDMYFLDVGKAWKRGYLLYGPPGTCKSTMIAAMANLLQYDVYDLELTAVASNTELRKLLINTTSKSIIVIEDIDCSLDVTAKREEEKEEKKAEEPAEKDKKDKKKEEKKKKKGHVTLSSLLNTVDGLWSACPGERIIVFTTNHVEKLDKALIRRGRMDEHIELSYCRFEAFKVLAKNYLDTEWHDLFPMIKQLLVETEMTPADVADKLMRKSDTENADGNLMRLIRALEEAKNEAKRKAEEEEDKKKECVEFAEEKNIIDEDCDH